MFLKPQNLKKGDKIAITATAKIVDEASIERALHVFETWGLECVVSEHVLSEYHQYAGRDEQRFSDLQKVLDDPEIKAVFCARGGYGTIRIIDQVNFDKFLQHPKWMIGFSDITVLHASLLKLGVQCIHGPMPKVFPEQDEFGCLENLRKILFENDNNFMILSHQLNRTGIAKAQLVGGNLSILCSLLGSGTSVDTSGKILFIEDVCEYLYHLDRMMWALKRSGKLDKLAGLVVGAFSDMKDNDIPFGKNAEEIIAEHIAEYDYPVCFGFPVGHISNNQPLVMGAEYVLDVGEKVELGIKNFCGSQCKLHRVY